MAEARYNMRAVVVQTGVPAPTLRSWERRYGFPTPARTTTDRRLYSDADIQAIRRVKAQTQRGLSVSQAVRAVNAPAHAEAQPAGDTPSSDGQTASALAPVALAGKLVDACAAYDEHGAEIVLSAAFAMHPADLVVLTVIMPALAEVGEQWARGALSVAVEHFASHLVRRRLLALLTQLPTVQTEPPVVLACVPGEQHELGLLALGLFLRWAGVAIVYLGADVPIEALVRCLQETGAAVACLSATAPESAAALTDTVSGLRAAGASTAIVAGGSAARLAALPGDVLALDLDLRAAAAHIAAGRPRA